MMGDGYKPHAIMGMQILSQEIIKRIHSNKLCAKDNTTATLKFRDEIIHSMRMNLGTRALITVSPVDMSDYAVDMRVVFELGNNLLQAMLAHKLDLPTLKSVAKELAKIHFDVHLKYQNYAGEKFPLTSDWTDLFNFYAS